MKRLGVDIGGVIIDRVGNDSDTSFYGPNYLLTPAVPHVFEELHRIAAAEFPENVWLISKCGPVTEAKTREWLDYHNFYGRTGITPDHVVFCRERADKAPIAADLGITHFIDDRLEVLQYLVGVVPHLYLFGQARSESEPAMPVSDQMIAVQNWPELARRLSSGHND